MTLSRNEIEYCKDLGDSYLDIQKTRVAMELRLFQLENKHLTKMNLCTKTVEDNTDKGKKKTGIKFTRANEPIEDELKPLRRLMKKFNALVDKGEKTTETEFKSWLETVPEEYNQGNYGKTKDFLEMTIKGLENKLKTARERIKLALLELSDRSETFKRFKIRFNDLEKVEKGILDDAEAVYGKTELWRWCEITKGLGPVAALTFLSNVDVFTSPTVGHAWSNFGLIPGKKLVRGESSNFNPKVKARILGVICTNIIRSGDPYYVALYEIKKSYHQRRPDLLAKKDEESKSWLMHMHRMSYRVLGKLLISHAYMLIKSDLGVGTTEIFHRNPVPIKPVVQIEMDRILENYQKNHELMLEKLKPLWEATEKSTTSEYPKALDAYYDELKHPTIKFV